MYGKHYVNTRVKSVLFEGYWAVRSSCSSLTGEVKNDGKPRFAGLPLTLVSFQDFTVAHLEVHVGSGNPNLSP